MEKVNRYVFLSVISRIFFVRVGVKKCPGFLNRVLNCFYTGHTTCSEVQLLVTLHKGEDLHKEIENLTSILKCGC